jgi:hypothetical protein
VILKNYVLLLFDQCFVVKKKAGIAQGASTQSASVVLTAAEANITLSVCPDVPVIYAVPTPCTDPAWQIRPDDKYFFRNANMRTTIISRAFLPVPQLCPTDCIYTKIELFWNGCIFESGKILLTLKNNKHGRTIQPCLLYDNDDSFQNLKNTVLLIRPPTSQTVLNL